MWTHALHTDGATWSQEDIMMWRLRGVLTMLGWALLPALSFGQAAPNVVFYSTVLAPFDGTPTFGASAAVAFGWSALGAPSYGKPNDPGAVYVFASGALS